MFDPSGLKDRYSRLVAWQGGVWVNYWTQTVPKLKIEETLDPVTDDLVEQKEVVDNDTDFLRNGITAEDENMTGAAIIPFEPPTPPALPPRSSPPVLGALTKSEADAAAKAERQSAKDLEKERKKAEKNREKALKKEQADAKKAMKAAQPKPGRHFIVLPTGLSQMLGGGENWEKVMISGVEDEVAAHCGLFIRGQNEDYDGLVERVGKKVLAWCETL